MDGIIAARAARERRTAVKVEDEYMRFVSLRQRTKPDDVAGRALFLSSSSGARVAGELLGVSGNMEWEV